MVKQRLASSAPAFSLLAPLPSFSPSIVPTVSVNPIPRSSRHSALPTLQPFRFQLRPPSALGRCDPASSCGRHPAPRPSHAGRASSARPSHVIPSRQSDQNRNCLIQPFHFSFCSTAFLSLGPLAHPFRRFCQLGVVMTATMHFVNRSAWKYARFSTPRVRHLFGIRMMAKAPGLRVAAVSTVGNSCAAPGLGSEGRNGEVQTADQPSGKSFARRVIQALFQPGKSLVFFP